jgi:signal transduction histidine kinase
MGARAADGAGAGVTRSVERFGRLERWIAWVRLGAVPFAVFQVAVSEYHPGYRIWAWLIVSALAVGAVALFALSRRSLGQRAQSILSLTSLAFDVAVLSGFTIVYAYEAGTPTRQLLYLGVVEAAVRYGIVGAIAIAVASAPVLSSFEVLRGRENAPHEFRWDYVTFQLGVEVILGLIVGWLVHRLASETVVADERAVEAETLRDELGRRVDLLDAANRCARALSSSLELDEAFSTFIRELSALLEYERVAIITAEGADAHTLATSGRGDAVVFPAGTRAPVEGTLLADVIASGLTIERQEFDPSRYPEERELLALGLRARVAAPMYAGPRAVGMLSVSRAEPNSFSRVDVELLTLLGRLVGSAVQNIRAYESERATVEELRRLSALRADFVSLVSHELRSPMAAVIGSARTLQQRWRELTPEQRDAFLALIGDETSRLALLVGDVLDTSRIEAGTFSFSFADVDLASLLRDAVAAAELGQDEVPVALQLSEPLPRLRGDAERLRQVVGNLLDNAIKYSPHGKPVDVRAWAENGNVRIGVRDRGPGVAPEHRKLIFEKFGRATGGAAKPGTGLGLFIARSIAEAHGGSVTVDSAAGGGAEFLLTLPLATS